MRRGAWVVVACSLWSCLPVGRLVKVENTVPPSTPGVDRLRAGVAEVELTPPPGVPTYGFSLTGAAHAEGYWLRLKGRIIVLQSGATRIAMMQLDLGAASPLLHRKIAERIEHLGIGAPQLVMATTHTHGGPGAIFGDKFFNAAVGGRGGFDENLVDDLAARIAAGVEVAVKNLKNARLAWGQGQVSKTASSNRSREAWLNNFADGHVELPGDVDRTLTLVRIDSEATDGTTTPLATWTIFAVHGNSIGPVRADEPKASLFHSDIHGLAARLIARRIETRRADVSRGSFLAATTTGAEGDVTPGDIPGGPEGHGVQGLALTTKVAEAIAEVADQVHASLDKAIARDGADKLDLSVVYDEASVRGANTTKGRLCPSAVLGGPQIRGSEEGRGVPQWAAPILRADEGLVDLPHGCTATRVKVLGTFQEIAVMPDDFPDVTAFQLVTFGDSINGLALASVPGEPTTEVGRLVMDAIRRERWKGKVAVMGLTNAYLLYITTPAEYLIQDYEGGGTIYGGHEGTFVAEQFGRLAARWKAGKVVPVRFDLRRTFRPGEQVDMIPGPTAPRCDPSKWTAGALEEHAGDVVFHWLGASAEEKCELAKVRIECGGKTLEDDRGFLQDDEGFSFEVRRDGAYDWSATWAKTGQSAQGCEFVVEAPGSEDGPERSQPGAAIRSKRFSVAR